MSAEQETRQHAPAVRAFSFGTPARLLAGAALLHVATTVAVFVTGRYRLLPEFFGPDGIAGSFASDGGVYMKEARLLVEALWTEGPGAWLAAPFPLHAKLYALCFAALSWCFGFTILSAEPLNLLCYLAILALVYWLGKECFDARTGVLAAATVALWPSFLLHTTQLLKDPLFIVALLALSATSVRLLTRSHSLASGLGHGVAGGAASAAIWLVRAATWTAALAVSLCTVGLLVARRVREGRLPAGNAAGAAVLLVLSCGVYLLVEPYFVPGPDSPAGKALGVQPIPPACAERMGAALLRVQRGTVFSSLHAEVLRSRIMATCAHGSGSNIDTEVELNDIGEIILYLPRAALIGFFAPFPGMWFAQGAQVGFAGRALSGAEMLATYLFELLALAGLWARRERLAVWLLASVCAVGITSLGLLMPNVGTLYRLRYVFWILLVVLAAGGASRIIDGRARRGGRAAASERARA
jgi:hypothetical protein